MRPHDTMTRLIALSLMGGLALSPLAAAHAQTPRGNNTHGTSIHPTDVARPTDGTARPADTIERPVSNTRTPVHRSDSNTPLRSDLGTANPNINTTVGSTGSTEPTGSTPVSGSGVGTGGTGVGR